MRSYHHFGSESNAVNASATKGKHIVMKNGPYNGDPKAHLAKSIDEIPPPTTLAGDLTIWRNTALPRALKMPKVETIWLKDIISLSVTPVLSFGSPAPYE